LTDAVTDRSRDKTLSAAQPAASTPPVADPRRWLILALIFTIIVVTFIDRQTMAMLAPVLRSVFHLTNTGYGRIVSALQFGMMSGEFPMGWLMDRWGARLGLTAAVLWWSTATGTQVFARSGWNLGISRFWMGSAEGGNYSGGMKTVSRIFPDKERTLAISIFNSGSVVGTTVAPPLIVFLLHRYGFRVALLSPAILALAWVPFWWFAQRRDQVRQQAEANDAVARIPLSAMLSQSSAWAVMLCRMLIGPVMQFYWYWTPSYLYSAHHLSLTKIGMVGWIPFFLGIFGGLAGGWSAGWLRARGFSIYATRRITMYGSGVACIVSMAVPWMTTTATALTMISIAIMADNFLSANMFAAITDLFPSELVGRATGLTGVSGGLSGLLLPLLTGYLVDRFSWKPVFVLIAFMPILGAIALFACGRRYHQFPANAPSAAAVS
jgi:MFS transporter, ACS family, hexuronate transporter